MRFGGYGSKGEVHCAIFSWDKLLVNQSDEHVQCENKVRWISPEGLTPKADRCTQNSREVNFLLFIIELRASVGPSALVNTLADNPDNKYEQISVILS